MAKSSRPIPVPLAQRLRFLMSQHLQGWIFAATAVSVVYLWFAQTPRVVLTGQVEVLRIEVPAIRDGILTLSETPVSRLDRVEKGVTAIAQFDVTETLLEMQTLSVEREQLVAQLESERQRVSQQKLQWSRDSQQSERQLEQQSIDRVRARLSGRQRVDQLTSDLSQLNQQRRTLGIKRQETDSSLASLEIQLQALTEQRSRVQRLVELRMKPSSQLAGIDEQLLLHHASLSNSRNISQSLSNEMSQVDAQLDRLQLQLRDAQSSFDSIDRQLGNAASQTPAISLINPTAPVPFDLDPEIAIAPFAQAIAVHDAKIKVLANRIANSEMKAPASGSISEVHARPGTFVQTGDPIATIASDQRRWVIAYMDRLNQITISDQTRVQIKVVGRKPIAADSSIEELGDHFEIVPPQLRRRAETVQWGVPVKVRLPAEMDVVPGQMVQLVIQ